MPPPLVRSLLIVGLIVGLLCAAGSTLAQAPAAPARFEGTLVLMTGSAEQEVANDEAVANFYLELQDGDLARAQSQLNRRVADGVAALKRADPKAQIETAGYNSYPIYSKDSGRRITGWRVRQNVTLRTSELGGLAKTVAAGQQQLALGGIDFRLSRTARERVEGELIQRAIAHLNARVGAAAQSLDVPKSRVRIEELNFGVPAERPPIVALARAQAMAPEAVAEPQFDAGRTTQQVTVTAKVRFLRE